MKIDIDAVAGGRVRADETMIGQTYQKEGDPRVLLRVPRVGHATQAPFVALHSGLTIRYHGEELLLPFPCKVVRDD